MNILFITPYLPVQGIHGGGNRMFALIRELSRTHRIFLASLIEHEHLPYVERISEFCREVRVVKRVQRSGPIPPSFTPGLIWREFTSPALRSEIARMCARHPIDLVNVKYEAMADYLPPGYPSVLSIYELRSHAAYRQFRCSGGARKWGYLLQMLKWLHYESRMFPRFTRIVTITEKEKSLVRRIAPGAMVHVAPMGTDGDYFSPREEAAGGADFIFVGNFWHTPNVDAMRWFCDSILPAIREKVPGATLDIVGCQSREQLAFLAGMPGVTIHGQVEDIRPFLASAKLFINPIRLGSGMRGKLLEVFAMARPTLSTSIGAQGLEHLRDRCYAPADDAESFACEAVALRKDRRRRAEMGREARRAFEAGYEWRAVAAGLDRVYADASVAATRQRGRPGIAAPPAFCSVPWAMAWISQQGDVYPCCPWPLGLGKNLLRDGSLKDIWFSAEWVRFREQVARGEYPTDICKHCREAGHYSTLGKDFIQGSVPQAYFKELDRCDLTPAEARLRRDLEFIFSAHDYDASALPPSEVRRMARLLRRGRKLRSRGKKGDPAFAKLLKLLRVFYDFYTRNPRPEVVAPHRIPKFVLSCNARCAMCPMVLDGELEAGGFMDDELVDASLSSPEDMLKVWPASTELLLHPKWRSIVARIKEARVHLAVSTNGLTLSESASRYLVDSRIDALGVSINGATKEVFEEVMARCDFDKFLKNLRYFVEYNRSKGSPVGISFAMVAMKRSIHELPAVMTLIEKIAGPTHLILIPLHVPGSDAQRAFYVREHVGNLPDETLVRIFREAARREKELGITVTCFYHFTLDAVASDLSLIPRVED